MKEILQAHFSFDDTFKCIIAHYANLNSSSINKPFLNYEQSHILFSFLRFRIYVYFNEAFCQKLYEETMIF